MLNGDRGTCSHACAAGLTYNGISALSHLGRLPRKGAKDPKAKKMSSEFIDNLTKWLVSRQTLLLQEDEDLSIAEENEPLEETTMSRPQFHVLGAHRVDAEGDKVESPKSSPGGLFSEDMRWVGVNGRCNKVADTCYTFWVGGSLGVSSTYISIKAGEA